MDGVFASQEFTCSKDACCRDECWDGYVCGHTKCDKIRHEVIQEKVGVAMWCTRWGKQDWNDLKV